MNAWRLPELGRFVTVGVANTLIGLLIIYSAKFFLKLDDIAANVLGYSIALIVSFKLNSHWTFEYRERQLPALLKFLAVAAVSYGMNLLVVALAIRHFHINGYISQIFGIPAYTLTSYLLNKYFVFAKKIEAHS